MNLKIVIQLPDKLKNEIDDIANDLYDDYKGLYAKKDNFWITLREINNVDSFMFRQIKSALYSVSSKSDPFVLYCHELLLLNPRKKSSLVYSLRGLTSKLVSLHQNINSSLYTRGIDRDEEIETPNIEIAKKVSYKQLPFIRTPQVPIEVASIELIEQKRTLTGVEYKKIMEYPLFGGYLLVSKIEDDKVKCENSFGKSVTLDILEMPKEIKLKDVIIKTGASYTVDQNETRVRAIHEQIHKEKQKNIEKG